MGTIKRLPEPVRSTMRSGIVVFDLTRVIEELVFNSLDAGAKKVSVYVAVGACYVKVADDGCGISRDGLALLGERYANVWKRVKYEHHMIPVEYICGIILTSKVQRMADMDVASGNFGFRGEALSSIADVSVLDIVTKARGRPNGYRKIMKGSKCLYMEIDDHIKDVGTTVVVRDLFYNQPVRRKCMQSSPKKILHLVSFKVVDIESEEELLCTHPSSALSLLMSIFGIEYSSSLHELNISDGVLKLCGYVSDPCSNFSIKAFQYVSDINSRFVCKGPIHKLLNHLASRFEHPDPQMSNSVSQKGKKSRPQPCPAYILNISCPLSLYDLTFEPSKTHAEFKDWNLILTFIEKVMQQLWMESTINGESSTHAADSFQKNDIWQEGNNIALAEQDLSGFAIKKCEVKNHLSSHHLLSSPLTMLTKEVDHLFHGKHDKVPRQEFYSNVSELEDEQADMEYVFQSDYMATATKENFLLSDDCFLEDSFNTRERFSDCIESHFLSSEWQNESPKIESVARNISLVSVLPFDHCELPFSNSNKKPMLQSCLSQRSLSHDRDLFASKEAFEFLDDCYKNKRRRLCSDENVGIPEGDQRFDIFPCAWQQDEASYAQQLHADIDRAEMSADFDLLSGASAKSFSPNGKLYVEGKGLASDSILQTEMYGSGSHSSKSDWCSVTSNPFCHAKDWDDEHFPDDMESERSKRWSKKENYWHFPDSYEIMSKLSSLDNCFSSCTSSVLDFKDSADSSKAIYKFLQWHNQHDEFSLQQSDVSTGETDWLLLESGSKESKRTGNYERQVNRSRYRGCEQDHVPNKRSRRSNSAPPFYSQNTRFVSLNNHSMRNEEKPQTQLFDNGLTSPEDNDFEHLSFQPSEAEEDLTRSTKSNVKDIPDVMLNMKEIPKGNTEHSQQPEAYDSSVEGFMPKDAHESIDYGTKWQNGSKQIANHMSSNVDSQRNILDISSGFLHLAGNLLVPESIHKNCLQDARVLQQVDKKFIPIVAGGTLAVIDQHAADERIRLEELRQKLNDKVLSGEAKTVAYLDAEQELILPEIGYQLLHNYGEQVREWGWICNIQGSGTFKKNLNILHQQTTVITLLAVPCVLGVNLSDGDLLEFLQQLADTDGSSTIPPSVLRVLNYKACRGAIMFGDSLLPSECSLIVEELKQTSLCFQCAHGRPTTVPVVRMVALHKQIAKLGVLNDSWHGLRRHELSLERAAQRLSAARD
ncbi:unnamed protein product [Dovyalis caffra]|uniref:DNA mismatch repair protein MLH3 n=1 Tax=Dovyalis caffra TaxID=77055 RepID=A0AAV1SS83_9ROSI|nr:unnamed protein product [Dovyalis caffra]